MKKSLLISIAILVLCCVVALTGCQTQQAETTNAVFNEEEGIVAQGVIEAQEVSINTKIAGRIVKLHIEEGKEVNAGDVLVEISSDELQAKEKQVKAMVEEAQAAYDAAKGQVEAAQAVYEKAKNGARKQEIAQAQANYDLWQKTYDRVQKLYEKGAVSAQKVDEVKTQLEVAAQTLSMAKEGARSEDISSAEAMVVSARGMEQAASAKLQEAKGALDEVQAYLQDTKIKSPISGTITEISADEGELVSTGMSIATVTDLNDVWVEVNVQETDIAKINLGQKVKVKIPSYSDEVFSGEVVRINQKPDFAVKRATNDNGSFDIQAFGVKIKIDNSDKVVRPGMTAFVQFAQ